MQAHTINTEEAPNKWWAAKDRSMRNIANASHYTEAQRIRAERMKLGLELCYAGIVYTPSYGKQGVSVKVVGIVSDKKSLKTLEAEWESLGVIKKQSAQGITYRFKK